MAQHMASTIAAPGNEVPITFLGGQSTQPSQGTARLDTLVARPPALAIAAPQQGSEARLQALVASTSALPNPADAAGLLAPRANVTTDRPMAAIEDGPSPSVAAIADTADTSASEPAKKKPFHVLTEKIMAARLKLKTNRAKALWGGHVSNYLCGISFHACGKRHMLLIACDAQ